MREVDPHWRCRWCNGRDGVVVLDAGNQPAADAFPPVGTPGPDPSFPLAMVMCTACRLAQLEVDPTGADEPRGLEPAALVDQARSAMADLARAGVVRPGVRIAEYPSPHGGSWLGWAAGASMTIAGPGQEADVVVDSLGLMHEPEQRAALAARARRLAPGGVLAVHVHSLATICRDGTWNALRHGHYAYYSVPVLVAMGAAVGLTAVGAWQYPLYGGTVMVAFTARATGGGGEQGWALAGGTRARAARRLAGICRQETAAGMQDPDRVARLGTAMTASVTGLAGYVRDARRRGLTVAGYGAASRAVALLAAAGLTGREVTMIGDGSTAKHGRAMPGSRIPIVSPEALAAFAPDRVLLFVADLLEEVRRELPAVQEAGRWVLVEPTIAEIAPGAPTGNAVPSNRSLSG